MNEGDEKRTRGTLEARRLLVGNQQQQARKDDALGDHDEFEPEVSGLERVVKAAELGCRPSSGGCVQLW